MLCRTSGPLAGGPQMDAATYLWDTASSRDKHHVSCLRIPLSYIESLPPERLPFQRERVAHHQYAMLLGVHVLMGQLKMPPHVHDKVHIGTLILAWYGKPQCQRV